MLGTHPAPPLGTQHRKSPVWLRDVEKNYPQCRRKKKKMLAVINETHFWRNGSCGILQKKVHIQ